VTAPARTLVDLAGVLDERDLADAVDRACVLGLVTVGEVRRVLDELGAPGRPGVARLRALLAATGSAVGESSARMAG
jgi:hypothetical protein